MARKNKGKIKERAKQKAITSRLMTISLAVDNYIYINKPISLTQAEKFLEEVTSLKIKCKDERSLQVIDKLRTFMKIIIKEQSMCDSNVNNVQMINELRSKKIITLDSLTNKDTAQVLTKDYCNRDLIKKQNDKTVNEERMSEVINSKDLQNNKQLTEFKHTHTRNNMQDDIDGLRRDDVSTKASQKAAKTTYSKTNKLETKNNGTKSNLSSAKTKKYNKATPKHKSRTDLSWIKNIKFVRETCSDERTNLQIEDTFWTDLSLPTLYDFDA